MLLYSSRYFVDSCCFHLNSGASTVGPYIVYRNRKRSLLSRATVREEFVETKYEVLDVIGGLIILVQVDASPPLIE